MTNTRATSLNPYLLSAGRRAYQESHGEYVIAGNSLTIARVPDHFTLETICEIAPAANTGQDLYVSGTLKTGRVMVKDEDVCLHCGLCAERCPTGAWDMQKFLLDLALADDRVRPRQPRTVPVAAMATGT